MRLSSCLTVLLLLLALLHGGGQRHHCCCHQQLISPCLFLDLAGCSQTASAPVWWVLHVALNGPGVQLDQLLLPAQLHVSAAAYAHQICGWYAYLLLD
jgi:hypothetical protein